MPDTSGDNRQHVLKKDQSHNVHKILSTQFLKEFSYYTIWVSNTILILYMQKIYLKHTCLKLFSLCSPIRVFVRACLQARLHRVLQKFNQLMSVSVKKVQYYFFNFMKWCTRVENWQRNYIHMQQSTSIRYNGPLSNWQISGRSFNYTQVYLRHQ